MLEFRVDIEITQIALLPFSPCVAKESARILASTLEVYVYPAEGQAAEEQVDKSRRRLAVVRK